MNEHDETAGGASRRCRAPRYAVVLTAVVALLTGLVWTNVGGAGDSFDRLARTLGLPWHAADRDSDGDGLPDHIEEDGWNAKGLGRLVTDPRNVDSDRDGLTDAQEAGAVVSGSRSTTIYAGVSDPTRDDTDGDGVGDGDEYFLDMHPLRDDTDGDGLLDEAELDFGSDPALDNPDNDSYSDEEERERGSDPLAYDLKATEALGAFAAGAAAGDWGWGARLVPISDAQRQSAEYLAGSLFSGYLGVGDLRDAAVDLGRLDLLAAVDDLMGAAPALGDAKKTATKLIEFARRSDRARRAVETVIRRMPLPKSVKGRVKRGLTRGKVILPSRFDLGPTDNVVYTGKGYVGITNDFTRRTAQHASVGRSFTPKALAAAKGLTRGEARAIEEACIDQLGMEHTGGALQNKRHSISPRDPDYEAALAWGRWFLSRSKASCA